ncbi:MAG: sensor histidine kinase, partial [Myxococcales bacterium]
QRIRGFRLGKTGRALLLDAARRPFISPADVPTLEGALPEGALREPQVLELELGGAPHLAALAPASLVPWTALVWRERAEALESAETLKLSTLVALALALLAALAIALLVASSLNRPIRELAHGAMQFGAGQTDYRIPLQRNDELGELADTFNEMAYQLGVQHEKLQSFNTELQKQVELKTGEIKELQAQMLQSQKMTAMSDLGAGLAHEINNPLCGVLGNAQVLLLGHPVGDPDYEPLKDIENEALRIKRIVSNLQALANPVGDGERVRADVNRLLDAAVRPLEEQLRSERVQVVREFQGAVPALLGNPALLEQVFQHLIRNARTAMLPEGGTLTLRTSAPEGQVVRVEVEDTGKGIAREHLSRIFDPFFTTKRDWNGSGLGLSVSHRIVETHGGRILVKSEPGRGTAFTLVFPAAPADTHLV